MTDLRPRLAAFLLALALLPPSYASGGDRAIGRVGGEAITERRLEEALARDPGLSREEALRLIEERLLVLQWAKAKGVAPVSAEEVDRAVDSIRQGNRLSPDEFVEALARQGIPLPRFREELREKILVNRATAAALAGKVAVPDEEIEARWRKEYPPRPTVTLSHVFFALPPDLPEPARQEKVRLAGEVAERVRLGGLSFAEAVQRYSDDEATRGSAGHLGVFKPGELFPEMEKAAAALSPGQVGGPIPGPDGLHVILLAGRASTDPPPLASVKEELAGRLREEKGEAARKGWIEELSREYLVEIFPDPPAPPPAR